MNESKLGSIGITLAGHKNRILKNLPGVQEVVPDRRSRLGTGEDFGLNDVLGSLKTMDYDLEDAVCLVSSPLIFR